ncbi:hypothetical protein CCACVL1_07784 [Corchorus capsularis]|uniref:Uncharacterized protein n=1 Tax=Corchorus capsularis TaxID=210143 RepID=A0A1R3J420_COCAP|nr:hypothetical protein CCACVL1_07784 [Corchorus capsularis]
MTPRTLKEAPFHLKSQDPNLKLLILNKTDVIRNMKTFNLMRATAKPPKTYFFHPQPEADEIRAQNGSF